MKKILLLFGALFFTITLIAQSENEASRALKQIIEDFRVSVIEHNDEEKFNNLFLHESITWATIYTGKSKASILEKRPDFKFHSSDFKSFYKYVTGKNVEEKFYNVKIDVRDKFATISFDYTFNVDTNIQNWGIEYWSLMLVDDEWKITSVTWTTNLQKNEKCPFVYDQYFRLDK